MMLSPSHSPRWFFCAASPWFQENHPSQPPSDEMREGTCAAWVADAVLKGDAHSAADMTGETHSNGWVVTPDMVDHVQLYIDLVQSRGGVISSEQWVQLSPHIAGRLDASANLTSGVLSVDDLKYGFEIVEIVENTTMIIYGAAEYLRLNDPSITQVELGIFQPRAFHPLGIHRVWKLSVEELMIRARDIITAGDKVFEPSPLATPGKHCKRCRAATSCAALTMSVYADHSYIEDSRQRHMTADELTREMNALDEIETRLKARKGAVYSETEQRIAKGEFIKGWGLMQSYGNRVLTVDPKVVEALTGVKATEEKPKTPAQLEREGVPVAVMKHMSMTPPIGLKLKRLPKDYFTRAFK